MMVYYVTSVMSYLLSICYFSNAINTRKSCTIEDLLEVKSEAEQFMTSMLSPIPVEDFFTNYFEKRPIAIRQRPPGYYEGLLDLNTIGDFLKSREIDVKDEGTMNSVFKNKIKHGGNWKLVKRVLKNGDWWTTSPNLTTLPLEVVYAYFEQKGYSIVIDKIQEFHPPLKMATNLLESLFGVVVNANMYLTPYGAHQAFDSHFDWMDGIIVQVMGCKKWKIYTSPTASRPLPDTVFKLNQNYDQQIKNSQRQERGSNFDNAFETFDLRSGSLLYIPRGFAHEAATNCSNIDKINYKNKRSQDNKENVDDDGSTLNAGHAVDIAANVASLHITFGLEVATDSTVEIYLHHYILIYFNSINTASTESTKSSIRLCSDKFSNGRGYSRTIIDGMLRIDNNSESTIHESNDIHNSRNDEKSKDASSQMNSSDFLLDMENTFVLLQNGSHKLTFQIGNLTNNDLIHLILHVATTIDSSYAKEKHGTHKNTQKSYDNEVNDERNNDNELKSVRSDVLRQGVAITTFTSKNKYQSMLHQILPEALVYLKDFFTFYTMDFIITEALLLAFRMNMIDANIEKIVVDFDSRKDEEGYGFISEEGSDVISVSGDDQINDVSNFAKKNENNKENTNINNSGNKDRNNDGNDRNKNKNDGKMTGRKLDPFKIPEYIRYFLSSSNRSMINPSYTARQKIRNVCQESHELSDMNLNASERRDIILNIQDSKWRFINPKKSVNLKLFSKVKSIIEKILMSLHDHDAENRDEWTGADDTEKNESEKEFSDHLYCMAWKSMISKLRNDRLSRS